MAGVFISYRRADSDIAAGRLADDLSEIFGPDTIFRDIDRLEPGVNYVIALNRVLDSCVALIVVIGPRWLTITDEKGNRRLTDPNDWVRAEIHKALERQIPLIPVLLSGTMMPRETEIPNDLKPLLDRQAMDLSDRHWKQDLEILVRALEKIPGMMRRVLEESPVRDADAIYRPLVADLENLERAMAGLVLAKGKWLVLAQLHMVEAAIAPISEARRDVSVLGDDSKRRGVREVNEYGWILLKGIFREQWSAGNGRDQIEAFRQIPRPYRGQTRTPADVERIIEKAKVDLFKMEDAAKKSTRWAH